MKCNHDKDLITTVLDCGAKFGWGLEVGSKPELLMAMSLLGQIPGSLLVCNGYKDAQYMRLVGGWVLALMSCTPCRRLPLLQVHL